MALLVVESERNSGPAIFEQSTREANEVSGDGYSSCSS